jgi:hypothetical protein
MAVGSTVDFRSCVGKKLGDPFGCSCGPEAAFTVVSV